MFSHFFIDRPNFACVVCIVIILLGLIALPMLPVEQFPDVVPPTVTISAIYPGASAQDVINAVAMPLEEALNGVDGMIYMSTEATSNGTLSITVSFDIGTDPDTASVLIQNRVKQVEPRLPEEVRRLGVAVNKRSGNFICLVALSEKIDEDSPEGGTKSGQYLANYASLYIKDQIARVEGVGEVMVFDRREFSMRIWLDVDIMAARDISVQEVHAAIRQQNTQVAAGRLGLDPVPEGIQTNLAIVTLGRLQDVEQFENIIVRIDEQGGALRLKDIAQIELGSADYTSEAWFNGRTATAIAVMPQSGANSLKVAEGVINLMDSLEESLARSGLAYSIPFNATTFIQATVDEFWETLLHCVVLVVLVVFLFLQDWRAALIPILTIPVSIIGTFFLMWCFGFSLNTMSLFGLILVIGIVVDDAIVVVENTQRIIDEEQIDSNAAAKKSMIQVIGPVIALVLIMMAVFLPTSMMQGVIGRLYQQFALTIAGAVAISGICAVTLAPALCAILLRPSVPKEKRFIVFRIFNYFFDGFMVFYLKTVKRAIRFAPVILLLWFLLVGGLFFVYTILPKGFVPNEDQGVMFMEVKLPEGASMERTAEILTRVERIILAERELIYSKEYYERGWLRQLYDRFWNKKKTYVENGGVESTISINGFSLMSGVGSNLGTVFIPLNPWDDRRVKGFHIPLMHNPMDEGLRIPAIQARLEKRLAGIPEAQFMIITPPPIMIGMTSGVSYVLLDTRGVVPTELARVRDDLKHRAVDYDPIVFMISSFEPNSPQLYFDIDRDKAMRMGVNLAEVFAALQSYLGIAYVNDFNMVGKTYRVQMQAKGEYRGNIQGALRIKVKNMNGEMVPLEAFTTVEEISGPQLLTRYNMFASVAMTGIIRGDRSTGDGIKKMEELSRDLPDGFRYEWTGLSYQEKRVGNQMVMFLFISVAFTFLILVAQYESWSSPLIIMMAVPLGIAGSFLSVVVFSLFATGLPAQFDFMSLMMWLMSAEINLYTQIGFLVMIGFSAKNAVLIVEFAREHREQGAKLVESAYEAGRLRVRPILMTSSAFIMGLFPLIWADGAGSNARNAIGNGIFGGLLTEVMLGIYVTPVLFVLIHGTAEWGNRHIKAFMAQSRVRSEKAAGPSEVTLRRGD